MCRFLVATLHLSPVASPSRWHSAAIEYSPHRPANQKFPGGLLRRSGFHIDIVGNGAEAVRVWGSLP